jgi:hypothetical protein
VRLTLRVGASGTKSLPLILGARPASCAEINSSKPETASGYNYIYPVSVSKPLRVWCDMTLGGGLEYYVCTNCVSVNRVTDKNGCQDVGLEMMIGRSYEHWRSVERFILHQLNGSSLTDYFKVIPGVYKPCSGRHDCPNRIMNSTNCASGTSSCPWRSYDGGPWWIRDTPEIGTDGRYKSSPQPDGDYSSNCFLGSNGWHNNELILNDLYCTYYSGRQYICSTSSKPKSTITSGDAYIHGVTSLSNGDTAACGKFTSSVLIGNETLTSRGAEDAMVVKLDAAGNAAWAVAAGTSGNGWFADIATNQSDDAVVAVGAFTGSFAFGSSISVPSNCGCSRSSNCVNSSNYASCGGAGFVCGAQVRHASLGLGYVVRNGYGAVSPILQVCFDTKTNGHLNTYGCTQTACDAPRWGCTS